MLLKVELFSTLAAGLARSFRFIMIAYILYTILAGLALLLLLLYLRNPYIFQDLSYTITAIKIAIRMRKFKKQKPFYSILDCFLDQVARQPHKKFIVFEESSYTYSQADKESNRVARALSEHGQLKEGDTVALFLGNEPQFVWIWLALTKLGCKASLLNYNIRSKSLLHCFSCCEAKVLVAGAGKLGKYYLFVIMNFRFCALFIFSVALGIGDDVFLSHLPLIKRVFTCQMPVH